MKKPKKETLPCLALPHQARPRPALPRQALPQSTNSPPSALRRFDAGSLRKA
jgi:hypothetical protein